MAQEADAHTRTNGSGALDQGLRELLDAYEFFDTQWRIDWGLSPVEKLVITHLWTHQVAPMGEIAARVGLTRGALTALVDRLERDGYVSREPDPDEPSNRCVQLTTKGWESRAALDAAIHEVTRGRELPAVTEFLTRAGEILRANAERMRGQLDRQAEEG